MNSLIDWIDVWIFSWKKLFWKTCFWLFFLDFCERFQVDVLSFGSCHLNGSIFFITHSRDLRIDAPQKKDMGGSINGPPNGWYGWFISWMVPIDWLLN